MPRAFPQPASATTLKLSRVWLLAAFASLVVLTAALRVEAQSPPTGLITVNTSGGGSGGQLQRRSVTPDGRFVVFVSELGAYTANDTNAGFGVPGGFGLADVFVRDRQTGRTTLVSINKQGTDSGDGPSQQPVITPDGRYVAFVSQARDLVELPAGATVFQNVYVRDLLTGTTTLVSRNLAGTSVGNHQSGGHQSNSSLSISADGRYVSFESQASDLVANDTNGQRDVFVRDLVAGTTALVSINRTGTASANGESSYSLMTPDGRHVVFRSGATNLVDTSVALGVPQIYIRDMQTNLTRLVSVNRLGTGGGNDASDNRTQYDIDVSADGRYVAFVSSASDLVENDANGSSGSDTGQDVFVRDVQANQTFLVSVNSAGTGSPNGNSGAIAMSANGRFVAFASFANNVVANDSNTQEDVFLRDIQTNTTRLITIDRNGAAAGVGGSINGPNFLFTNRISLSDDGRYVAFTSNSPDLVNVTDVNAIEIYPPGWDVFVRDVQTNETRLVSYNRAGTATGDMWSYSPEITPDGRHVVFASVARDLVGPDKIEGQDIFIHVFLPQPPEVRFQSAITNVDESAQTATVVVTLTGQAAAPVTMNYSTADGVAVAGFDYTTTSGTLTFQPGETQKTFDVVILNDVRDEDTEKINLRLTDLAGPAKMGEPAVAAVSINDDDAAPSISIGDVSVGEGDSGFPSVLFPVTLSAPSGKIVTVDAATQGITAQSGVDFNAAGGRITFQPGQTTFLAQVNIIPDTVQEANETFALNLSNPSNATIADTQGIATIVDDDGAVFTKISLNTNNFTTTETAGKVDIQVVRTGNTSVESSVFYVTTNGSASDKSDYEAAAGTLRFAAGETQKTITLFITDDAFQESEEQFNFFLFAPAGATLGTPSSAIVRITSDDASTGDSPVKWGANFNSGFFVRQHYRDFLNRDPDAAGLAFWKGQIDECETRPEAERQGCREVRRINVSGAFFLAIEFQETGYLAYKTYGAAFGVRSINGRVPLTYREFLPDAQDLQRGVIIGEPGSEAVLEQNKRIFFDAFVVRPFFTSLYPQTMTAAEFVDTLDRNAGGVLSTSERNDLVGRLSGGQITRAQVLRAVAEDADLHTRELNRAFVLMQYFGYLRRDPDNSGYDFWLGKLEQFGGNYVAAEMVKAFLTSGEYLQRFGI